MQAPCPDSERIHNSPPIYDHVSGLREGSSENQSEKGKLNWFT